MKSSQISNIVLALAVLVLAVQLGMRKLNNKPQEVKIVKEKEMTNNTLDIIHKRKSVRNFSNQKVSKEQLETIIKAGMAAPTAVNMQPWAFIAIDDRAMLDKLSEGLPYAKMLSTAQAAIVVCGDLNKAYEPRPEYWIQDCSAATENILLATEALGLGAVWTAVYPEEDRMAFVKKELNLPDHIIALNVIPLGHPTGKDHPKDKWKPENLHWGKW
ncbi:MAG: nitroreductase family protein [Bacteroidales bacterium]